MEPYLFGLIVGLIIYKASVKFDWGNGLFGPGGGSSDDGFWDTFGDE